MTRSPARKPNIVLIAADRWRGDCLGCLRSHHLVMTSHLDRLAAEGALFGRAYTGGPVCVLQRVALLTGQAASRFGLPHNLATRSPIESAAGLARAAALRTRMRRRL